MTEPSYGEKDLHRPEHDDLEADAHEPSRAIAEEDNGETNLGQGSGSGTSSSGANMAEGSAGPADPGRGAPSG